MSLMLLLWLPLGLSDHPVVLSSLETEVCWSLVWFCDGYTNVNLI